jgi:hypothetical protein
MGRLVILILFLAATVGVRAQTCTLSASGTVDWNNATCLACDEGVSVTS